jgi:hypothetical protein
MEPQGRDRQRNRGFFSGMIRGVSNPRDGCGTKVVVGTHPGERIGPARRHRASSALPQREEDTNEDQQRRGQHREDRCVSLSHLLTLLGTHTMANRSEWTLLLGTPRSTRAPSAASIRGSGPQMKYCRR